MSFREEKRRGKICIFPECKARVKTKETKECLKVSKVFSLFPKKAKKREFSGQGSTKLYFLLFLWQHFPAIGQKTVYPSVSVENYTIDLPDFQGPFDLLLFFIERDELDIYDIPIAKISADFLAYIRSMELMNIDLASEFIWVASTLMRIKAKMLLPRKALDEAGEEIDPRQELVARLLEYKRYKAVLQELQELEEQQLQRYERGNVLLELQDIANKALADSELENLSLYKLLQAYEGALRRLQEERNRPIHRIIRYAYSIESQRDFLLDSLREKQEIHFSDIFLSCENRIHAIFRFLALLDLLQLEQVCIEGGEEEFNSFRLRIPTTI